MKAHLVTLSLLLASCYTAAPVEAPQTGNAVQYAVDHSVFLDEAGCSGIRVTPRVVLTAKHCVADDAAPGSRFDSKGGLVKYVDPKYDFALVEYPPLGVYNQPLVYVNMRDYAVGEHVYVVGWPVQLGSDEQELTVTDGVVAGPTKGNGELRITAPVYFGNSGGGVWGDDGALLGVAVSIYAAGVPGYQYPMPYPAQSFVVPMRLIMDHL